MINVDTITELLIRQFAEIMAKDSDYYSAYHILFSNEQQFMKEQDREKGAIYIVVKFLPASLNFGQTILPITINAIAERNKIEVCQKLLLEYAQTYNLTNNEDLTIKQTYTSPAVSSNFNEIFDGFRSLFYMSGTFLISANSNPISVYVSGEESALDCITAALDFNVQLDTQPFFDTNNITKSIAKIGTLTLNFTSYLTDIEVINKVLAIATVDLEKAPDGINTTFNFDIVFRNGYALKNVAFKLVNAAMEQNIGELPVIGLTFTN